METDARIAALEAERDESARALQEARKSLEGLRSDLQLVGRACSRTITRADSGDEKTCRWCKRGNCEHTQACPVMTLIDVVGLCVGDGVSRWALEETAGLRKEA